MRKRFMMWALSGAMLGVAVCALPGRLVAAEAQATAPKSFIYINGNLDGENEIETFARDKKTGRLAFLGRTATGGMGFPFNGGFQQHAVVTDGKSLYAVNPGAQPGNPNNYGTISAFRVGQDGSLKLLNVVSSNGLRPVSLAIQGNLLYVANQGSVPGSGEGLPGSYSGFKVLAGGALEPIPGSKIDLPKDSSPADILITPDGSRLVGMQLFANKIDTFTINKNGTLANRQTTTAGGGPFGAAYSPSHPNNLFVTLAVPEVFGAPAPGVGTYRLEKNAHLNLLVNKTVEASRDPCWITFTKDGEHFWTDTFIPRTLFLFSAKPNGQIKLESSLKGVDLPKPPAGVVVGATDITISADDKFLYQLRVFSVPDGAIPVTPSVHVYRVTKNWDTNAGLEFVQVESLPKDLSEAGVMGLVIVDRK